MVVAVGMWPAAPGIPGESNLTRGDGFPDLTALPQRIVFVGGGYTAYEFGHIAPRPGPPSRSCIRVPGRWSTSTRTSSRGSPNAAVQLAGPHPAQGLTKDMRSFGVS